MAKKKSQPHLRKKQRERRDISEFKQLVAAPQDLGVVLAAGSSTALQLPGNGRLAVSCSSAVAAGDFSLDIGSSKVLNVPALGANDVYNPGVWGEKGMSVVVNRSGAPVGTVTVSVMDGVGRLLSIATATFS